jgi:hypothetical protein
MAEGEAGLELPIGLTEQKFLQQLARIESRAIKSAQRAERGFVKSNQQIGNSFGSMSRQSTAQLQNVSFQLQDIFVQISGGQGAVRALSQQLPQLLGGFGALGAVFGVVVAAGVPLAASLLGMGKEAEDLGKALDRLETAVGDYKKAAEAAVAPTADLVQKYGEATGAARELLEQVARLSRLEAASALRDNITALAATFQDLQSYITLADGEIQQFGEGSSGLETLAAKLQEQFGLTLPQARELMALLSDAQAARSVEEKAAAIGEVSRFLEQAVSSSDDMNGSLLEGARAAAEGSLSAYELAEATRDAEDAANGVAVASSGIAPVIDDANSAAAGLTATLRGAMAELNNVVQGIQAAQRQALATARIKLNTVGQPVERAGQLAQQDYLEKSGSAAYAAISRGNYGALDSLNGQAADIANGAREIAALEEQVSAAEEAFRKSQAGSSGGGRKSSGRSSGGGGGSGRAARAEAPFFGDIEKDLANLERQISLVGKSNEEVATAKARWELLDEAKKRGIPVNAELNAQIDAQAAQVGRLTAELEAAETSQQQFDDAIQGVADSMAGTLLAGESLRDGLAQVFKQIAADIINSGIQNALSSQFSGGGFNLGSLFGGLFGGTQVAGNDALSGALRGISGFRAGGGSVSAGRAYVVGENEPELFVPNVSGTILNGAQAQRAMGQAGGGAGEVNININVTGARGNAEIQEMVSSGVRQGLSSYDKALPTRVQSIQANPRKR